jgi:predicted anti-sigma-YlaC factor YlaD
MSHFDYEAMIFADEPLLPAESIELKNHLQGCEECRGLATAWQGVQADLGAAAIMEPEAGFAGRWQERLIIDRQRVHRKQVQSILGVSLAGALLLSLALAIIWLPVLDTPKVYLYAFLYQVLNVVVAADLMQGLVVGLIRSITSSVSLLTWVVLFGIVCQLGVLWLVSLRLATKTRSV